VKFPDIGKDIERFVEERSVGGDSWRRTGVYTFDGNKPIGQKVTYRESKSTFNQSTSARYRTAVSYNCMWHAIIGGDQQNDTKVSLG